MPGTWPARIRQAIFHLGRYLWVGLAGLGLVGALMTMSQWGHIAFAVREVVEALMRRWF